MAEVWRTLIDAGFEMVPVDAQHVELRYGHHRARMMLQISLRPLNPSDIGAIIAREPALHLLVVPAATAEVRRAVERAAWSWLVLEPGRARGMIRLGDEVVQIGADSFDEVRQGGRPGRVPWGWLTVVRCLLGQPPATQRMLAVWAQVSQPRVSQVLTELADRQLVDRAGTGWLVRDFDRLLSRWLERYPGPGGISTYWYGLDPAREQAQVAIRRLTSLVGSRPGAARGRVARPAEPVAVVSGDVAADLIAPWHSPSRAVIYTRSGVDLAEVGLNPAGAEEATLELIVPADCGVWPLAASEPTMRADQSMVIADPLQVLWDLQRAPGPDAGEAVARLSEKLREHHRARHAPVAS